jgi:hypothetical protein
MRPSRWRRRRPRAALEPRVSRPPARRKEGPSRSGELQRQRGAASRAACTPRPRRVPPRRRASRQPGVSGRPASMGRASRRKTSRRGPGRARRRASAARSRGAPPAVEPGVEQAQRGARVADAHLVHAFRVAARLRAGRLSGGAGVAEHHFAAWSRACVRRQRDGCARTGALASSRAKPAPPCRARTAQSVRGQLQPMKSARRACQQLELGSRIGIRARPACTSPSSSASSTSAAQADRSVLRRALTRGTSRRRPALDGEAQPRLGDRPEAPASPGGSAASPRAAPSSSRATSPPRTTPRVFTPTMRRRPAARTRSTRPLRQSARSSVS